MKQTNKTSRWKMLPLRYKLSIYFISFSAIMLACLWFFQTVFLEISYTQIKKTQVTNCADLIAEVVKSETGSIETIDKVSKNNEMSVYVYDSSSEIIVNRYTSEYINPTGRLDIQMHKVYNYYRLAMEYGGVYSTVESVGGESLGTFSFDKSFSQNNINNRSEVKLSSFISSVKNMVYAEIVPLEGDRECFVLVTAMITPVSSVIETLRAQLIIVTVVFLILAIVLAFCVSRHISKPLGTLNTQVKELARQNYKVDFDGNGYLEVRELSKTLNFTRDELVKVESLRQELIANISHDLRTPLTMITGYAEVMRDLPDENNAENLQVIIDEANRLSSLVNDMLDMSKIQSGAIELECNEYNLTESIRDIFNRYTKLRQQEGYNIRLIADKNVYVYADQIKMGQVIYNFINNAINHCGQDKTVIVTQKILYGKVRIEVTDHGDGIPEDKLQYIWDRYYKVDKTHKRGVIGTGLGLSIVKRILDMHSARYGVKSKEGIGSTFWFELDVKSTEAVKKSK